MEKMKLYTQGYISTVMKAMHFDSYIDGGDGKMIIQMGIRGAKTITNKKLFNRTKWIWN